MALFEWTDDFSVGIHSIDMQHKGLFKAFNDLYTAFQNENQLAVEKALGDMWQYTSDHFEYEEKYFAIHGYPDAEAHKAEHAALVNQVNDQVLKFNAGELVLTPDLAEFLANWLKKHINGTDKQYSEFFQSKGMR